MDDTKLGAKMSGRIRGTDDDMGGKENEHVGRVNVSKPTL